MFLLFVWECFFRCVIDVLERILGGNGFEFVLMFVCCGLGVWDLVWVLLEFSFCIVDECVLVLSVCCFEWVLMFVIWVCLVRFGREILLVDGLVDCRMGGNWFVLVLSGIFGVDGLWFVRIKYFVVVRVKKDVLIIFSVEVWNLDRMFGWGCFGWGYLFLFIL